MITNSLKIERGLRDSRAVFFVTQYPQKANDDWYEIALREGWTVHSGLLLIKHSEVIIKTSKHDKQLFVFQGIASMMDKMPDFSRKMEEAIYWTVDGVELGDKKVKILLVGTEKEYVKLLSNFENLDSIMNRMKRIG